MAKGTVSVPQAVAEDPKAEAKERDSRISLSDDDLLDAPKKADDSDDDLLGATEPLVGSEAHQAAEAAKKKVADEAAKKKAAAEADEEAAAKKEAEAAA